MQKRTIDQYSNITLLVALCAITILSIAATYYQTFALQTIETVYPEEEETYDDIE